MQAALNTARTHNALKMGSHEPMAYSACRIYKLSGGADRQMANNYHYIQQENMNYNYKIWIKILKIYLTPKDE